VAYTSAFGAQQSSTPKKKAPSLTTDDVVRPKVESSAEEAGQPSGAASAKAEGDKVSPEEAAWRDNVAAAREKAKQTQRAAEEAELKVTNLRNELSRSGQTANERNDIAAELEEVGRQVLDLRAQARAAAEELNRLLEEGKEQGFRETPGPKAQSEDGSPNEKYYRERYDKLMQESRDAERKTMLFENRLRELNQKITTNSVTGDNFYIARLQQDRDDAQRQLEEAQTTRDRVRAEVEVLKDEARRAGLPPGIFR
jgi:hypothetical protein